ncbi:MAG: ribosome hibernation-promoting factor, HPF/YfiA family [Anaerovoracaceae bacterium]
MKGGVGGDPASEKLMKTVLTCKSVHMSDDLRTKVEKKLNKLDKFFQDEETVKVVCTLHKGQVQMDATISALGHVFKSEIETKDIFEGTETIVDKLSAQLSKQKTKKVDKQKRQKEREYEDLEEIEEIEE